MFSVQSLRSLIASRALVRCPVQTFSLVQGFHSLNSGTWTPSSLASLSGGAKGNPGVRLYSSEEVKLPEVVDFEQVKQHIGKLQGRHKKHLLFVDFSQQCPQKTGEGPRFLDMSVRRLFHAFPNSSLKMSYSVNLLLNKYETILLIRFHKIQPALLNTLLKVTVIYRVRTNKSKMSLNQ